MLATVCLLRAGQPRRAGDAAKSGQFVGQFSWDKYDPTVVKGLTFSGPNEIYRLPPTSATEIGEWMKTGMPFRKTLPWAHVQRIPFVYSEMSRYDVHYFN